MIARGRPRPDVSYPAGQPFMAREQKHIYMTHRAAHQWGVMVFDAHRRLWLEPRRWYRTRREARDALADHACHLCPDARLDRPRARENPS
jgi:hypothetical protein